MHFLLRSPKPQKERGHYEKIGERRGDEAEEDDHRHRMYDLESGYVAQDGRRQVGEGCNRRARYDRPKPFACTAQDELGTERRALLQTELPAVIDQQNAVAR